MNKWTMLKIVSLMACMGYAIVYYQYPHKCIGGLMLLFGVVGVVAFNMEGRK